MLYRPGPCLAADHLCGGVALLAQAQLEAEDLRQSLLSRSLTGEVQVMEMEEAYKQVRRMPIFLCFRTRSCGPPLLPSRTTLLGWMDGRAGAERAQEEAGRGREAGERGRAAPGTHGAAAGEKPGDRQAFLLSTLLDLTAAGVVVADVA